MNAAFPHTRPRHRKAQLMTHSIFSKAVLTVALLLASTSMLAAQDIVGTWFKLNLSFRLATANEFFEDGQQGPSFDGNPGSISGKAIAYIHITQRVDFDEYTYDIYYPTKDGLILHEVDNYLLLRDQGIVEELFFDIPILKKPGGDLDLIGEVDVIVNGQLSVKFDDDDEVKSAKFQSFGGEASGFIKTDKVGVSGVGSVKVKMKSVPEDKVPPILQN